MYTYTLTTSKKGNTLELDGKLPTEWQKGDYLKFINDTNTDVEYKIVAAQTGSNPSPSRVITDPPQVKVPDPVDG